MIDYFKRKIQGEFTIIIQGKPHRYSIDNIHNYQKFGKVILSCYEDDDLSEYNIPNNVLVVKNKIPTQKFYNGYNVFLQCVTTLGALLATKTRYVIKTRSDEFYEDLSEIIDLIRKNPNKFISNNIFFCGISKPLHPSDHLFGGKTKILRETFEILWQRCYNLSDVNTLNVPSDRVGIPWHKDCGPEVLIFTSFLECNKSLDKLKKDVVSHDEILKIMLENCDIVPFEKFGHSQWSMSHWELRGDNRHIIGRSYLNKNEGVIKSLDEYLNV